jgi:hypothetical protein
MSDAPKTSEPWISWHRLTKRWMIRVRLRGQVAHIGYARELDAAIRLRDEWCRRWFGSVEAALALRRKCVKADEAARRMAGLTSSQTSTPTSPTSVEPCGNEQNNIEESLPASATTPSKTLMEELEKELET